MSTTGTLKRWIPAEDQVIRDAWERRRLGDVARELGRRDSEVSTRARTIGVRELGRRWRSHSHGFATERGRVIRHYNPRSSGLPQRVMEHRAVAAEKIGRPLRPGEIVHHIDCDKRNNHPENLDVLKDRAAHARAHRSIEGLLAGLIRDGVVEYDPQSATYRRTA